MKPHLHFSVTSLTNLIALLGFGFAMLKDPSAFFGSSFLAFVSEVLVITTVGTLFEQSDGGPAVGQPSAESQPDR